ncbi:hypothetical protein NSPZN2_40630 [Nitrospira defluvii]|uniref:Uncharacterized protein n=1 Tax=Nitrospira defluvii TaxID=330214 RepID=A0ABM8RYH8_9BACT|nr:hypothetical protein NSPZN2_40630 [Nitrospira defluvii]
MRFDFRPILLVLSELILNLEYYYRLNAIFSFETSQKLILVC